LEGVVAGAKQRDVVALIAVDKVVAVTAQQRVDAIATKDGVVTGATVDGQAVERSEVAGRRETVVA
jgi:hypothetical protein